MQHFYESRRRLLLKTNIEIYQGLRQGKQLDEIKSYSLKQSKGISQKVYVEES